MRAPTIAQIEEAYGRPTADWPGNCHAVATALCLLVPGTRPQYGLYSGPVDPACAVGVFRDRHAAVGVVRHGWARTADGTVLDPTRWVFEALNPYVWVGPPGDEYDLGGEALRTALLGVRPRPDYDPAERHVSLAERAGSTPRWADLLEREVCPALGVSIREAAWVANLPRDVLLGDARAFYEDLEAMGLRALVPIDNWHEAMAGG